jgi:hypothetical protein
LTSQERENALAVVLAHEVRYDPSKMWYKSASEKWNAREGHLF